MGTHSKKRKQKKNDMVGNPDNNVAKVNTTMFENLKPKPGSNFYKTIKIDKTGSILEKKKRKKKKKPSIYGMTSEDIKKKTKKNYGGA